MGNVKFEKGMVFERYEKKYLLNTHQYLNFMMKLKPHMEMDEYGLHTICTLYYDTDDFSVIRRCLEKPDYKEKLRLRSYGIPNKESMVYLELKKKLGEVTYKRRVGLTLKEVTSYMERGVFPCEQGQVFQEIEWYKKQQELKGKVVLCYDRMAFFGKENSELRLTIDANIRFRESALLLEKGDYGREILPDGMRLMEIKAPGALPYWMAQILSQYKIYPASYSKYGTVYQKYISGKEVARYVG